MSSPHVRYVQLTLLVLVVAGPLLGLGHGLGITALHGGTRQRHHAHLDGHHAVAAHIAVAHDVQLQVVLAGTWRHEGHLHQLAVAAGGAVAAIAVVARDEFVSGGQCAGLGTIRLLCA